MPKHPFDCTCTPSSEGGGCSWPCAAAMWRYVMASTRGDRDARHQQQRRAPSSLFTVSHHHHQQPGPTRGASSVTQSPPPKQGNAVDARWGSGQSADPEAPLDPKTLPNTRNLEGEDECPPQTSLYETVRGRLSNAFRLIRTTLRFRRPPRPPDWEYDNAMGGGTIKKEEEVQQKGWERWLLIDTSLPAHYKWLGVVSLAVLYNIIFVTGRSVFWEINNRTPGLWWTLDYVCDFIYILDTIIRMHEGYLEQGLLVRDLKKLRQNYMTSRKWKTDIASLIPTDFAYSWWPPSSCQLRVPCPVIVRLNRIFRIGRFGEWFDRTETDTNYPNVFRICKVLLVILVLIHWNACLYFAISYAIGFGTDNWVYNLDGPKNSSLTRQYIYSFYWSTLTLTTIGETPVPENDVEYLFVVADFLAGVLIFATIVGNIGSMISNMNLARVEFQNRMDGVKQYMAFRKVGRELEGRVIRWFAYTWTESGALDEERVLGALPDKLKAEIAIRVHLDTLRKVRIFQDCEPGLLEALVLKLRLQVFSPGDFICRKGDVGKEMYIVKRGQLQVVADDSTTVLATLGAGSVFGEVSVLDIAGNRTGNRRTANVRSLGYSDLFCLAKDDLWVALADYPEARATLTERGCQLLRKDGLLDEEVFKNARDSQYSTEESVRKLEITVKGLQTRLARLMAEFGASQAKIKQRLSRVEHRRHSEIPSTSTSSASAARRRVHSLGGGRATNGAGSRDSNGSGSVLLGSGSGSGFPPQASGSDHRRTM